MDSGVEYWRATAFDISEAACLPACLFAICYVLAPYTDLVRQAIDKSLLTFSEAQPFARSILHCVEQVYMHKVPALTTRKTPGYYRKGSHSNHLGRRTGLTWNYHLAVLWLLPRSSNRKE